MRVIGDLSAIDDVSFGVEAFTLRDDLIPNDFDSVSVPLAESCCTHARIESDWFKYSKGNPAIFTPFETILSSLETSKLCKRNGKHIILTADANTVQSLCPKNCITFNKTGIEYYIQSAAVDFHLAVQAKIFIGNVKSSFTQLVFIARNFSNTYTYSEISGKKSCVRRVLNHSIDTHCRNGCELIYTRIATYPFYARIDCTNETSPSKNDQYLWV